MINSIVPPASTLLQAPAPTKRIRSVKVGTTVFVKAFNICAVIVAHTEPDGRYYVEWSEPARGGAARRGWLFREDFTVRKAANIGR